MLTGFQTGSVTIDNAAENNANSVSGAVPDGIYGLNTLFYFCCRSDNEETAAISLPLGTSFMLMRHETASQCQAVEGGLSFIQYLQKLLT